MAEEAENAGGSFKNILIGLASTIALGVGGYVTKQLTGEEDAPAATTAAAPVININQAAAAPAAAPKTIIVNKGGGSAAAPAQAAPAKPKAPTAKEELEKAPQW